MIIAELAARLGLRVQESEWKRGEELIKSLHTAAEAYLGVEAVKKVGELVEGVVEAGVQAKHMAERVGLSTDAVQELGYAASVSGSSAEGMQTSIQHLARGLEQLRTKGTGPAADAFRRLGINVHDSEIQHGNLDQVLEIVANRFAALPDGPLKTAEAMKLFGRSGTELIPLLNRGAGGIKELRAEAEKLGIVLDEEAIKKTEEFEESQKKMGATLTGLRNSAIMALLPSLQEMLEGLQAWVSENHEAIQSGLKFVVEALATAFRAVGVVIKDVTRIIREHQEFFQAVLVGILGYLAIFAVEAAIDWAIAFAPVLLIIGILAALGYAIKKVWEYFTGGPLTAREAFDRIKEGIQDLWDFLMNLPDEIEDAFMRAWDAIKDGAKAALEWVANLPVIKQLIEVYKYFTESGDEKAARTSAGVDFAVQSGTPWMAGLYGGQAGIDQAFKRIGSDEQMGNTIHVGDIHITATSQPGMDEAALAQHIGDQFDEKFNSKMRQALANVSGGKR